MRALVAFMIAFVLLAAAAPASPTPATATRPGVIPILTSTSPGTSRTAQSQASQPLAGPSAPGYYWYTSSGSADRWNTTTTPPTQQWASDSPGANYLSSHLLTNPGGVTSDILASAPGDYCNYYNTGTLNTPSGNTSIGSETGFSPPSPVSSYQLSTTPGSGSDSNTWGGSTCQADNYQNAQSNWEYQWGQWLNPAGDPNTTCNPNTNSVCGMQHTVSLAGTSDYPWSRAFKSPQLMISATFDPSSYADSTTPTQGIISWGYVCQILQDTSAGPGQSARYLEFCLDEWQPADMGGAVWNKDYYFCNSFIDSGQYAYVDWAQTGFDGPAPADPYVTLQSGWQTTTLDGSFGSRTYRAAITPQNLQNMVNNLNAARCPLPGTGIGVYSTNAANYRLVAIEHGAESVGPLRYLGTNGSQLQEWTAYHK